MSFITEWGSFYLPRLKGASLFFCSKITNSQNTQFSTAWLFLLALTDGPRKKKFSDISITSLSAQLTKVIKTVAKVKFEKSRCLFNSHLDTFQLYFFGVFV
jgi:hypothetical protein